MLPLALQAFVVVIIFLNYILLNCIQDTLWLLSEKVCVCMREALLLPRNAELRIDVHVCGEEERIQLCFSSQYTRTTDVYFFHGCFHLVLAYFSSVGL